MRYCTLYFCPWCGDPFPGDLGEEFTRLKEEAIGVERVEDMDLFEFEDFDDLPEDLLTDAWWRKGGYGPNNPALADDWDHSTKTDVLIDAGYPKQPPGFRQPPALSPHTCDLMMYSLEHESDMTIYLPHVREYGVRVIDLDLPVDFQKIRIKLMQFCPWCGDKLPDGLRGEWEKRLRDTGLEPNDPSVPTNLPDDLATDAWWRNESL